MCSEIWSDNNFDLYFSPIKLFGIGNTNQEQSKQLLADEGFSVFTVSKRKCLGEAGGTVNHWHYLVF